MWQEILYVFATLVLAYLVYLLVLHKGVRGAAYWCRWTRLVFEVWMERLLWQNKINNYDLSDTADYAKCGFVATPSEQELEKLKTLITDRHEDDMSMCGVDSEGRVVAARLVRLTHRRASVFLCVRDHTGALYILPNQPDSNQVNVSGDGWEAAGLSLTCVYPMRLWRLTFNGLLRRGCREEYVTEDSSEDGEQDEVVHVRLNLLWRAMRAPVDVWAQASTRLLAHALAAHSSTSLRAFLCEEGRKYEQWGCLHGTVMLPHHGTTTLSQDQQPQVWYLRGPRYHRWGLTKVVERGLTSFMYFNNGDVCSIHGHSTSTTHYVGGYVQEAAGDLRHVIWTDLSLEDLDQLPTRGNNLLTKFIAGWRKYEVWQRLGDSVTYYTGDPWTLGHTLHLTSVASNHSHGWGVTLLSQRYDELCPVPERESIPVVEVPRVNLELEDGAPLVLSLDDPLCRNPELTGGKASSLASLIAFTRLPHPHQGEYEVPPGVVVTVAAWRLQLKTYPDLQQAVRAVQQAVGTAQPAHIRDTCARAVEVCRGLEICPPVAEALQDALLKHLQHSCRVAVRSSGCAEDGQETSAAGQNETVLGVSGVPQVLAALAQCWASSFTFHSVEYRRQHGQGVEAGMGVVVQQMVEAEVAGVMFTIDPVTVNPAYIVITANYGLGESVVSAVVDSDTIVVRRSWRDQLSLVHTKLGAKKIKYTIKEEGGPVKEEVSEEERRKVCLSETTALRLAGLAVYLHQAFATHRDIEFALVQERVYLLQARPVTGLQVWTDYEVTHEHDTAIITDHELLTKANTGEVFPGSASPLTLSLIPQCIDLTFQKELSRIKWPFYTPEPQHVRLSPSYYSHVFLNMLEMQFRDNEEKMTAANRAMDLAIYGHIVSTDEYLAWGKERFGLASIFNRWIYLIFLVYDKLSNTRRVRRSQQMFGDYDLGCAWMDSAATLYQEITRNLPDLLQVSKTHIITSKVSSSTQCIALLLLAEGKEFSEENIADMALLLSTCAQVESADVPTALKELARVIGENEEAEEFLSITSEEGQVWLESHPGIVGDTYRSFLARHGHRCIKELDLSSLSWGLDPRPLVYTLQVMVSHPTSFKTTKTVVNVEDTLQRLQTHPSKNTRRALQWMLPLCREAVVHREATKSHVVKVLDGFRRAYRKLGDLLVGEGRLPSPDLVFFLSHYDLGHLVQQPAPALLAKAMRRRRLHCHLDNLKFPEISIGIPQPVSPLTPNEIKMKGSGQVIVGTPVCHGVVTAPARVVTSLHEATEIQNGDILVTVSTDVGWTPYFPLLAGVITEIGGLISHGAVVAREYGLPCIVGVQHATQVLHSGENILMNATRGTITRLTPAHDAHNNMGSENNHTTEMGNKNSSEDSSRPTTHR